MMMMPDVDRMTAWAPVLLIVAAASLTVACASAGRSWSGVPQLTTGAKRAATMPGSWEKVEALRPGSLLVVTLKNGDRREGAFRALRPGVLSLTDPAGMEFDVPRSEIGRVETQRARDGLANGALIGAGIGLGAALAILAVAGSGDGYVLPSAKWGAPLLLSSVGALTGALIDRAQKGQVIYVAP